jgi:hypothetical protein
MRYWLLVLDEDAYAEQQAYDFESVTPTAEIPAGASDGDEVALAGPEGVFAVGAITGKAVTYRRRKVELAEVGSAESASTASETPEGESSEATEGWGELTPSEWDDLGRSLPSPRHDRTDWLVSLSIPVEAADRAEAVRKFWSYARSLGPAELPTFVAPYGREIDGQAFLLGAEHEQDPEE